MATKEVLAGYRTLIYFSVLSVFQAFFMFKNLDTGATMFPWWIAGSAVFVGANKVNKIINAKNAILAGVGAGNEK
jgi:hypothetical protein